MKSFVSFAFALALPAAGFGCSTGEDLESSNQDGGVGSGGAPAMGTGGAGASSGGTHQGGAGGRGGASAGGGTSGAGTSGGASGVTGGSPSAGGTSGAGGAANGGSNSDGGPTGSGGNATGTGGGGTGFPADTFLPWAGGPAYYAKWTHGPPADENFFPIAVWLQSPSNATRYKNVGVNLFIGLWQGPTESQLTGLASAGVPTFCDQGGVWNSHLGDSTIWGWLQGDEPDNAQPRTGGGYDPCIPPSTVIARHDTMVQNDSTRPVWLNLGRGVSDTQWIGRGDCTGRTDMYTDYAKGGDILSYDIYPVNDGTGLEAVPKGVDNLRQWSNYEKPVVAAIEGSNIDNTTRPSPAQIESEVWMALIHGASGIMYFCHRFSPTFSETDCLDNTTTADGLTKINAQVRTLAPVLNQQSVGNGVTVASSASGAPIDVMLKRYSGATYVFAVVMRNQSTTGTFTLRDFADAASVEVIGENRTVSISGGAFEDDFSGYGVHRYKITR
jgi:hypothetical protein